MIERTRRLVSGILWPRLCVRSLSFSLRTLLLVVTLLAFIFALSKPHSSWQLVYTKSGVASDLEFSSNGRLLAAADAAGPLRRVWESRDGKELHCFCQPQPVPSSRNRDISLNTVDFSANDKLLFASSFQSKSAWDLQSGNQITLFGNPTDVELATAGRLVIECEGTGSQFRIGTGKGMRVRDMVDDEELAQLETPHKQCRYQALNQDERAAVIVYLDHCEWIPLRSTQSRASFALPKSPIRSRSASLGMESDGLDVSDLSYQIAVAPDATRFAIAEAGEVMVFFVDQPQKDGLHLSKVRSSVRSIAWSHNSQLLAIASEQDFTGASTIEIYCGMTGKLRALCRPAVSATIAFDNSNNRLIGITRSGWRVWNASTGHQIAEHPQSKYRDVAGVGDVSRTEPLIAVQCDSGLEVWRRMYPEAWEVTLQCSLIAITAICAICVTASTIVDQAKSHGLQKDTAPDVL